jgi:hypothetical protein
MESIFTAILKVHGPDFRKQPRKKNSITRIFGEKVPIVKRKSVSRNTLVAARQYYGPYIHMQQAF